MGASKVVSVVLPISEVWLADDETSQTETEHMAVHLGIRERLFATIGFFHLVSVFSWGRAHSEEVARGLHLIEGRPRDVARDS